MPHPCVVCGRSRMNPNNREEEYMFFGFPVNYDSRCKKWLEFCCREDLYRLTKKQLLQRMVCSKHFERKDFLNEYQDRLNCTAVPSIYDPKQSLYNITCVLCGRSRTDPPNSDYDGTTFHHFPGEEFRCLKWLDFVGIDSYYRLTRKEIFFCYICSKHFDKTQFTTGYRGRLIENAVPNIRNPEKSQNHEITRMEPKLFHVSEKSKRFEPLSTAVLESQACAACGRSRSDPRNKSERYKFHPFPAYEIGRCLRWCQFLGREDILKMSPNQIRKLVLCSKHFLTGQSFHKVGPCDAVPTIKEITESNVVDDVETNMIHNVKDNDNLDCQGLIKTTKRHDIQRPLVSSKKPKVENKPAPLAKKRGRSKRPTSINIPKIDALNIENRVKKLPLPPANWKIQIGNNNFQPLTIANTNNSNGITGDGKKMLLPFAGNISNLGAPIPVHSLSSIPPGFLIKINLPEQTQNTMKILGNPRNNVNVVDDDRIVDNVRSTKTIKRRRDKRNVETTNFQTIRKFNEEQTFDGNSSRMMNFTSQCDATTNDTIVERISNMKMMKVEVQEEEEVEEQEQEEEENRIEALDENFDTLEQIENPDENVDGFDEVAQEVEGHEDVESQGCQGQRTIMSSRARRTLLPIRTEVRYFLHKLKPHMQRLPRKARAQLKLSIVNMVIDRL